MAVLDNTKTKNSYNLCQHREEFGLEADWNLGGAVKKGSN